MARQAPLEKKVKRDRREEVLQAARSLFFEKGYRGTTIEQIARRADYSKRTVYLDFANKDEVFITVCTEGLRRLRDDLQSIPFEGITVEESVDRFLDVYLAFSHKRPQLFRMIFAEATPEIIANCSPEVRERVAELERACLGSVVVWAQRAIDDKRIPPMDPWRVAGMAVGSATGIILLSMGGSQTVFTQETLDSLVRQTVWMVWEGLKTTMTS